jgi:hypothetical protein
MIDDFLFNNFFFITIIEIFWEKCDFLVKIQLNLLIVWKLFANFFLYHYTENITLVMILNMLLHVIRELVYDFFGH